jgi:hypothetical protein
LLKSPRPSGMFEAFLQFSSTWGHRFLARFAPKPDILPPPHV